MRKNPLSNMSAHGGIITSEFLEIIRGDKVNNPRVEPQCFATFNAPNTPQDKRELDRQIDASFKQLLERWDALSNRYQRMTVSEARTKWMLPLFKELWFNPDFRREDILVNDDEKLRFHFSHRGWSSDSAPFIHMVAPAQDLEEASDGKDGEVVRRGRTRSPHDEMQAYLNVTNKCKWGIVTNGILLRILREYFHTTTKGYVEFDLENIFRERSFTDFRAMYRMVHASRFLPDQDGISPLEQFYKESVAAGVKVGENLRQNVKKAIEALGNGFLTPELIKKMIEDEEFCKAYYAELLRVVYRLLFLLFAEQRAMLPTKESLYIEEYSITRLRHKAEERHGKDDHKDLWEGLKVTFHMLKKGCPPLKFFGYNGSLLDDAELPKLSQLSCKNEDLLEAVRNLTLIEEEKVLKRINYLDLGVSEIGSIYESLLDFSPRVFTFDQQLNDEKVTANTFVLDPRGIVRKTSGSYYTSPRLIDELIKSALKPVVQDKLSKALEKEKALLTIKVCDPACGSGAFLIAANNYLGKELAKLRSTQAEPSDKEVRIATRDVLQHCIYGVDLNPMATELAKVSLWINSCVEDMPLNYLDHHIKCGNSLIGVTQQLVNKGIPDEAFISLEGYDRNFASRIRSKNAFERKNKLMVEFQSAEPYAQATDFALLDDLIEKSPEDVEEKKKRFINLITSERWQLTNVIADAWTVPFFWQLDGNSEPPTDATLRLIKSKGIRSTEHRLLEAIGVIAKKHRFFHWQLEFPDVFKESDGGFDCVMGNPPWEVLMPMSLEFFSRYDSNFKSYDKKKAAEVMDELLKDKTIDKNWSIYTREFELIGNFVRNSGAFSLLEKGVVGVGGVLNTYRLFLERFLQLVRKNGIFSVIVPSGFHTDLGTKSLRRYLFEHFEILGLYCFENRLKLFPIDSRFEFELLSAKKANITNTIPAVFMIHDPKEIEEKTINIPLDLIKKFSPDNFSIMEIKSQKDIEVLNKCFMYPLLGEKIRLSWNFALNTREFNMTLERYLFNTDHIGTVLYEGKMIWQFNSLFDEASYWVSTEIGRKDRIRKEIKMIDSNDRNKFLAYIGNVNPLVYKLYSKQEDTECSKENINLHYENYRIVLRSIASKTNERTLISTIIPKNKFIGHSLFCVIPISFNLDCALKRTQNFRECFTKNLSSSDALYLTAILNSFVVDYIIRQKTTTNLTSNFLYELPVPRTTEGNFFYDQIVPRAARLICYTKEFEELWKEVYRSSWELISLKDNGTSVLENWDQITAAWTEKCGVNDFDSMKRDSGQRIQLRCELDALIAHLYGIDREDLEWILSNFPIVSQKAKPLIMGTIREFDRLKEFLKHHDMS